MNFQEIKVAADNTHFLYKGNKIFEKEFLEVLKFHSPGLAPVKDETGSYHIKSDGKELYPERYSRTFGFYCNRAAVIKTGNCFHITDQGLRAYDQSYSWIGNFQENLCPVREGDKYYHIDLEGLKVYSDSFIYCGDFKDGIACVKTQKGPFRHIKVDGEFLHEKEFSDLGIYHKNYATAKDENGWCHIDKTGNAIYNQRYLTIEPFYNGFALVTHFDMQKVILDETGNEILSI